MLMAQSEWCSKGKHELGSRAGAKHALRQFNIVFGRPHCATQRVECEQACMGYITCAEQSKQRTFDLLTSVSLEPERCDC